MEAMTDQLPDKQMNPLGRALDGEPNRRVDATDLSWLRARHAERDATYRVLATWTIDTDDLTIADIVRDILIALSD